MRDCDIRPVLKARLNKTFQRMPSLIVDELGFNDHSARIDLAVVNCALHAYEIKSERDTLERLPSQLEHFLGQFHFVTVCAATKHLIGVASIADARVGIIEARRSSTGKIKLVSVRPPKRITQSNERICRLFWWNEAIEALKRHDLGRGAKKLNGETLRSRLLQHFDTPILLSELRQALVQRRAAQLQARQQTSDGLTQWP